MAIHKNNGRFVTKSNGEWVELPKHDAYCFTTQALRKEIMGTITAPSTTQSKTLQTKRNSALKKSVAGKKALLRRRISDEKAVGFSAMVHPAF